MERSRFIVKVGIAIVLIFVMLVGILIFKFERPSTRPKKLTGRGGDFAE